MTKDEAREILQKDGCGYGCFIPIRKNCNSTDCLLKEAVTMAIKALEQQTCTREDFIQYAKEHYGIDIEFKDSDKPDTFNELFGVEVCEDVVSRQAAIDALKQAYWNKDMQNAKDDPCIVDAMTDWAIRTIKDLPSVNPQQKTGHWIVHPKGIYAHLICDNCLSNAPYDCRTNYCSDCGAKMVES